MCLVHFLGVIPFLSMYLVSLWRTDGLPKNSEWRLVGPRPGCCGTSQLLDHASEKLFE
jgi:hypothetical protein